MKKNMYTNEPRKMNNLREERNADSSARRQIRDFLRSVIGATDPNVFYFSVGGMVMPLSRRV